VLKHPRERLIRVGAVKEVFVIASVDAFIRCAAAAADAERGRADELPRLVLVREQQVHEPTLQDLDQRRAAVSNHLRVVPYEATSGWS
jgi:hypothetical protein